MGLGLEAALGLQALGLGGNGGRSQDNFFADTGRINTSDKPETIQSKADPLSVTGQRDRQGEETYIEVRGPATLGGPSRTPYQRVLPRYQKAAEQAIQRNRIPRAKQQRVREYFDSLQRGRP